MDFTFCATFSRLGYLFGYYHIFLGICNIYAICIVVCCLDTNHVLVSCLFLRFSTCYFHISDLHLFAHLMWLYWYRFYWAPCPSTWGYHRTSRSWRSGNKTYKTNSTLWFARKRVLFSLCEVMTRTNKHNQKHRCVGDVQFAWILKYLSSSISFKALCSSGKLSLKASSAGTEQILLLCIVMLIC